MKSKEEIKLKLDYLQKLYESFMSVPIEYRDFERIHSIQDRMSILEWVLK